MLQCTYGSQRQPTEIGSFLPPFGPYRTNRSHQVLWSLLILSYHQTINKFVFKRRKGLRDGSAVYCFCRGSGLNL